MINTKTVTASLIACVALSAGCATDTPSEQSGVININSEAKALESEIIAFYTGDDAPVEGGAEVSGEGEWTEGQDPRQFCEEESRRRQGGGEHKGEDEDGEVDEGPDRDDDEDGEVDEGHDGEREDDDDEVDEGPAGDDDEVDDDEPVMMSVEPNMSVDEVEPDAELTQECLERNRESVRHRVRGCLEACAEQLSEDVEDVRAELLACYEMTCEELPHPEHSESRGDDHEGDDHEGDDHEGDDHEGDDHEGDDHEGDDHEGDDHEG